MQSICTDPAYRLSKAGGAGAHTHARTQTCARRYGCYSQKRKCQLLEGRAGRIDLNIASIGTKVSICWYRIDTFVVVPLLDEQQRTPHSFSQSPTFCYHCSARLETSSSLLMAVPSDRPLRSASWASSWTPPSPSSPTSSPSPSLLFNTSKTFSIPRCLTLTTWNRIDIKIHGIARQGSGNFQRVAKRGRGFQVRGGKSWSDSAVIGISVSVCRSCSEERCEARILSDLLLLLFLHVLRCRSCLLKLAVLGRAIVANVSLTWRLSAGAGPICHRRCRRTHLQQRAAII